MRKSLGRDNNEGEIMNWPQDRKAAFRWVAKTFGTPEAERTERQRDLAGAGFCYAICELTGSNSIYRWASIFRYQCGMVGLWWWPHGTAHDTQRSLFCSLMAALSDEEFKELGA